MSDIELLEAAARAAGLPWDQWVIDGNDRWNALTNDGDAFRLLVYRGLDLKVDGFKAQAREPLGMDWHVETHDGSHKDAQRAARRVVVLAAIDQ